MQTIRADKLSGLTVGQVAARDDTIEVTCRRCRQSRMMLPADLVAEFGEDFPVAEIHRQLRCTNCDKRDALRVEVAWHD